MKKSAVLFVALFAAFSLGAQNDSLTFVNGNWSSEQAGEGLVLRKCHFTDGLFNSAQNISVLEVTDRRFDLVEAPSETLWKTSEFAEEYGAIAAVNCGFFRMRKPFGSVMYYRQDREERYPNLDEHKIHGRSTRQTGSVVITDGRVFIVKNGSPMDSERYIDGEDVVTSGPLMMVGGEMEDVSVEGFNTARHPRTAIGKKPDGTILLVVVDGRSKGNAEGMSIFELQKVMGWLGCESALNLDGGGSSALVVGGVVVNCPSDNRKFDNAGERSVHNAIIVR